MLNKFSESTPAVSRRRFVGGSMVGAAALLSASEPVWADDDHRPSDPFIGLLKGRYHPAPQLPDLGLSGVNLADTSYITTKIYPVFGVPGSRDPDDARAGITTWWIGCINWTRRGRNLTNFAYATSAATSSPSNRLVAGWRGVYRLN